MTVSWSWTIEMYLSSAWTDVSADVLIRNHDIAVKRGIDGNDVMSRVAAPGSLNFYLNNSEANSAGLLGYYSPDHANCRTDFAINTPVRVKLTSGATTYYIFRGWITDIEPLAGQYGKRETAVLCTDFMQRLAEHKLSGIPVQVNKRPDQLAQTVLDNMANAPANTSLATDTITPSYGLHSETDERTTAMSAMQKIAQTALGYVFVRGDSSDGETFVYQMRHTRSSASLAATLDDTMSGLRLTYKTDVEKNRVVGLLHPAEIDSGASTLLASLTTEIAVDAGSTETITLRFRDPSGAATRISGINIVTSLIADTHYKMSATSGSGGNDMNADLTPTVSAGGNTVEIGLQNTGSTRGYVNKLDIYGDGVYLYDPVEIVEESGAADKTLNYDMFYQDNYYVAKDFVVAVHGRTSATDAVLESVMYYADADSALMGYALSVDIGSRVQITETATGVSDEYFVNSVAWRILRDGRLQVEYILESSSSTQFFVLDTNELDDSAVKLAF